MFTWICPACGKEVPPHETECPHCHGTGKLDEPKAATPAQPPAPASPPAGAQPQAPPPQQQYAIRQRRGMPGWLVALLVAAVIVGLGALAYFYVLPSNRTRPAVAQQQASPFEAPQQAAETPVNTGLARHIEVAGFRITEEAGQRPVVQFLVINHSAADIGDLAGKVTLYTDDPEKEITDFEFKTSRLGPYESIEFRTTISTSMRAYEIPDWQFLNANVEITSPVDQ